MSLTSFHLLFIAAATLLAFGLGVWALDAYATRGEAGALPLAAVSFVLGTGLIIYGARARARFKHMGAQ